MPPIPVHSSSPISPTAGLVADGTTPITAAEEKRSSVLGDGQIPAAIPATTAGLTQLHITNARPGASAVPAPTSASSPSSSRYTSTRTAPPPSTQISNSPPPPQPGAVASPFPAHPAQPATHRPSVPPPPKAGEIPKPASYCAPQYESSPTATPSYSPSAPLPPLPFHQQQPNLSTPTRAQPPASTTSTPHDLSHPPGYVQDSRASFEERPIEPYQPFANYSTHRRTPNGSDGGILDESPKNQRRMEEKEKGLWGDAVSWMKTIGGKLAEGEEALWKRINGQR
jgi:hypothetical protein